MSSAFETVPNISVYNRPVHVNATTNDTIVFTGVCWAIPNFDGLGIRRIEEIASLEEQRKFQALSISSVDLLSDPVLYQTPGDSETAPVGVNWWVVSNRASLSNAQLVAPLNPMVLLCSTCSADNPCSFDNECVEGACQCRNGGSGTLCQIAPLSDGKCDVFFNSPEFAYDGGDCCQATCVGTLDNQCGVVPVGSVPNIDIGFPHCKDPELIEHCESWASNKACFIRNSKPVRSVGSGAAFPTLSANGRVLVLAEKDIGIVRVFDLVGSEWVQRGRTLLGLEGTFGRYVALSTPPAAFVNGARTKIPIVLVVSGLSDTHVFRWTKSSVDWLEELIKIDSYSTRLQLATDLMDVPSSGPSSAWLLAFDTTSGTTAIFEGAVPTFELYESYSYYAALSGNGNFLARADEPTITLSANGVHSIDHALWITDWL